MNRSSGRRQSRGSAFIDELLVELSDHRRRWILYYLRRNHGPASVDELVRYLSEQTGRDPEDSAIVLEHTVLPRLDDFGIVDYDRSRGRVLYRGGSFTTEFLDSIVDWERDSR